VRLSLDGDVWTAAGAAYHYHAPLTLVSASPAAGSVDGGVIVAVKLQGRAMQVDSINTRVESAYGFSA